MTGDIIDCSKAVPGPLTVDVCVIGSGCGGATAAWELARAGKDVVVLEEGGDYTGAQLTGRDAGMYDQLYMERGGRATSDMGVSVLQGRVLGGGGVINACDVVPMPDGVLRHWVKRYGLSDFTPEALGPAREAALRDLSANPPREDQLNANNRLLREGTQALGWRGEVMLHNRVGCVGLGTCLIGCTANAKKNPRFVAIPNALAAGARVYIRARAVRLEHAEKELKTIAVRTLDPRGHHEQGSFEVRARTVVLAANAVASAELLLRSGVGNAHVGRHLSLQPQLPVTALFDDELRSFHGIPQAFACTEFEDLASDEHGWWGYRIESIFGTPGIVASLLPVLGAQGKEQMTLYPHLAASLLLAPDEPTGRVEVQSSGRLRVHYTLADEQKQRFRSAAKAAARIYFAAGAREVLVPAVPPVRLRSERDLPLIDAMTLRPASAPLLSAHQQGGVRMSPSAKTGAASPEGEVYGTRGVFVFDSSGYPSSASSHTMAPIIAVSRFQTERLLTRI